MTKNHIPIAYGTPISPPAYDNTPVYATAPPDDYHATGRDLHTMRGGGARVTMSTDGPRPLSTDCVRTLKEQGFTQGLIDTLSRNREVFPLSFWIVDNSGSMSNRDGHRLVSVPKSRRLQIVDCTRWVELQNTVQYHAQLATMLDSPTIFRLLNDPSRAAGPQQFSVAEREGHMDEDLAIATSTIQNTSPGGVTPLIGHIREIRSNIQALEPTLRKLGCRCAVVIATDGIPTDERGYTSKALKEEFARALQGLASLPVWLVVRLCTDEDAVVNYWNEIDSSLELGVEVLDDFTAEAQEVAEFNPWLNYALPLHRMRELGIHDRVFDLLDEQKLSKDELKDFFRILFGRDRMAQVPDPEVEWDKFVAAIGRLAQYEERHWNPVTKRLEPWVDVKKLKRAYKRGLFW